MLISPFYSEAIHFQKNPNKCPSIWMIDLSLHLLKDNAHNLSPKFYLIFHYFIVGF